MNAYKVTPVSRRTPTTTSRGVTLQDFLGIGVEVSITGLHSKSGGKTGTRGRRLLSLSPVKFARFIKVYPRTVMTSLGCDHRGLLRVIGIFYSIGEEGYLV